MIIKPVPVPCNDTPGSPQLPGALNVIPSGSQHQDPQAFQITRFCAPFTGVQQIAITVHMGGTARSAQVQDQSHIVTGHGSLMRYGYSLPNRNSYS
jgi:hypothetical protein